MEGLQYDYFGLFPVGRPLVRWRHDFRGAGYDCISQQLSLKYKKEMEG